MPDLIPTFSERLWSEEVALAEANSPPAPANPLVYEFSGGRRFAMAPNVFALPWPDQ